MDMDVMMRFLIGVLIGACLWVAGNRAHATTIPATPSTQTQPATYATQAPTQKWYMPTAGQSSSNPFNTKLESCSAWVATLGANASCPTVLTGTAAGGYDGCYYYWAPNGGACPNAGNVPIQPISSCPAGYGLQSGQCVATSLSCPGGWTLSGSTCSQTTYSCPSGYTLSGTNCNSNPDASGTQGPNLCIPATASPGGGACYNGTLYDYQTASNQFAIGGVQQWCGPTQSSGQVCTANTPQGATASPTSCPAGQVPGTINGQTVCLGAGDSNPAQKVETTTTTTTNAQGQPTGTTTTTTTTKDTGSGGTVTTTTKNPDGTTTTKTENAGPDTSKPELQRFCEQNPDASICKKSTWGGTCGAFACDGDAVQCAIAREIYTRDCALYDTPTTLSTLGNQVSSGADPQASQNPALEANRTTTSLTGSITQDTFLAPGGLADQQFVVSPRLTVTLPWSQLNFYLSIMGGIVVAFALVFAARIVVGVK